MKKIINKICFGFVVICTAFTLFSCFNEVDTLEFVNTPQSTYYQVTDTAKLEAAIDAILNEITIKFNETEMTVFQAKNDGKVTISRLDLSTTGVKTLIITTSDGSVKLNYVYKVLESQELFAGGKGTATEPYEIATPEQFMNIGKRVYGVTLPKATASEDLWMYYYQMAFPFLCGNNYYKIVNDIDLKNIIVKPLGAFGASNYVPFTGSIDGKKDENNNYVIKNMNITSVGDFASLFAGANGATFKNIDFENVYIQNKGTYGAVLWSNPGYNKSEYINKVFNVNIISGYIEAPRVGGICCEGSNTVFANCTVGSNSENNLVLMGLASATTGGITNVSTTRTYSYKLIKKDSSTDLNISISRLNNILGTSYSSLTGFCTNDDYTNSPDTYSISYLGEVNDEEYFLRTVIYECNVYASIVRGNTQGTKFIGVSNNTLIYNNNSLIEDNNQIEGIKYEDKVKVTIDPLSNPLESTAYDSVEYGIYGLFDNHNSSWPLIMLENDPSVLKKVDLNLENISVNQYNSNGDVVNTLYPSFTDEYGYTIKYFYYLNNKLVGIYNKTISLNNYQLSDGNRVLSWN